MVSGEQKKLQLERAAGLHEQGKLPEAISLYQSLLETQPDDIQTLCLCARACRETGLFEAAGKMMSRANRLAPDSAEVFLETGELALVTGDLNTADQVFCQLTENFPANSHFWLRRAQVNECLGNWHSSLTAYRRVIAEAGFSDWRLQLKLAQVLLQARDTTGAIDIYQQEAMEHPDRFEALLGLGSALTAAGQFDEAEKIYRTIVERHHQVTEAWRLIAMSKIFDSVDDPDIVRMQALLKENTPDAGMRANLHFALGKAFDDCASYESAFFHYERANAARRSLIPAFDPQQNSGWIDRIISAYKSPAKFQSTDARRPIFVIGMPRSGTTLVERLLSNHPDVAGLGEVYFFSAVIRTRLHGYPESVLNLNETELNRYAHLYCEETNGVPDGQLVWTDKMPGNFFFVGLILAVFPNARIVHVTRDAVDNALSVYQQDFKSEQTFAYDFSDIISYVRDYQRMMKHWHSVFHDSISVVSYESLIDDTANVMSGLLNDCGLSWSDACLSPVGNKQPVLTLSSWQSRQPLSSKRIGWKENYRDLIDPLFAGLTKV